MRIYYILLLLLGTCVFAQTAGRVVKVNGNVFIYGSGGSISRIEYGMKIVAGSEIVVEDESSFAVKRDDATLYMISKGSFVKLYEDGVELFRGNVWVKQDNAKKKTVVQTKNSRSESYSGEYMFSYSEKTGKSQILTLRGESNYSNMLEPSIKVRVKGGEFSFVQKDFQNGFPRQATAIGEKSLEYSKLAFKDFSGWEGITDSRKSRAVASTNQSVNSKRGRIAFVKKGYKEPIKQLSKTSRSIASVPMKAKSSMHHREATVRIFKTRLPESKRSPASTDPLESTISIFPTMNISRKMENQLEMTEKQRLIQEINNASIE